MSGVLGSGGTTGKNSGIVERPSISYETVEIWRVDTEATGNQDVIDNWEFAGAGNDGPAGASVGNPYTGNATKNMSQSSGTFTFPRVGKYLVEFCLNWYLANATQRYAQPVIAATPDNSTYVALSTSSGNTSMSTASVHSSAVAMAIIDCTNTALVKVKFKSSFANSGTVMWSSAQENVTYVKFMRLGDV
jgi:hypothetical protein